VNYFPGPALSATSITVTGGDIATTGQGTVGSPALGMKTTGLYESADNILVAETAGNARLQIAANSLGGVATLSGVLLTASGGFQTQGTLSPAQLTGSQTDYNPFGGAINTVSDVRVDLSNDWAINSMAAGGQGQHLWIWNISGHSLTLLHDDGATGTANQRFLCPNNTSVVVRQNGGVEVRYDTVSSRWRVIGA
jgi:hypothetical protein